MKLQHYTQGYLSTYTEDSAASKEVRYSVMQVKLKFSAASEDQALARGAAYANLKALASIESSG
jgi:hypothetical protein